VLLTSGDSDYSGCCHGNADSKQTSPSVWNFFVFKFHRISAFLVLNKPLAERHRTALRERPWHY